MHVIYIYIYITNSLMYSLEGCWLPWSYFNVFWGLLRYDLWTCKLNNPVLFCCLVSEGNVFIFHHAMTCTHHAVEGNYFPIHQSKIFVTKHILLMKINTDFIYICELLFKWRKRRENYKTKCCSNKVSYSCVSSIA